MDLNTKFENKVLQILIDILTSFSSDFQKKNIIYEKPKIEILKESRNEYESEFRVSFYQNGKYLDVIECHIYRNGEPIATIDEFKLWIETATKDLIGD